MILQLSNSGDGGVGLFGRGDLCGAGFRDGEPGVQPDDTTLFVTIRHPVEGGRWTDDPRDLISSFRNGLGSKEPAIVIISKASGHPVTGR